MEFREVVRKRKMVRSFTDEPVDPVVVERILEHAQRAPSAGFSQGFEFLVLSGAWDTARFWAATFPVEERLDFQWPGLFLAPLIVIPLSHKDAYLDRYAEPDKGWSDRAEARWPVPYWHIDTGMAALLMLLTATDEGLGAVFFGIFERSMQAFRATFGVPEAFTPIGALAIGHPAPDRPSSSLARGRRSFSEIVHRSHW